MSDAIVKFNNYMTQHTDKVPLLSVQSTDDKRFTVLRELLNSVFDDALSTMEQKDIDTISRTVKKYQVKGTSSGISGERTYGYDRSRVDRKMIRRRRPN